ncbi:putative Achaete-scute [Daphnia magna]|uniref:Uncharacterized protein n=2 Tax=Daphnia magna TaxID=35525 RepID=A0ABR0ADA2_9CRUS|nr:hypothetical protein OUZ56_008525 [Daphnia magna]KZS20045.1 putative Achaete-scute [Daphnia magna]
MSDQTDQPCPTSLFVSEANVFSMAWTSSTMGNDEIIRSYSNGTSVMKYLDDNCATGAETEKRNNTKSGFRHIPHIPHSVRPAFQVARRNARERRRVQSVNIAFSKLHQVVPAEFGEHEGNTTDKTKICDDARARRTSKVSILRRAIDYIKLLEEVLLIQNQAAVISYVA